MKLLVTGDFHITEKNYKDILVIFPQILNIAKRADAICLLGDIFDNEIPTPSDIDLFVNFLVEIRKLNKKIFMISGNHNNKNGIYADQWIDKILDITYHPTILRLRVDNKNILMAHIALKESKTYSNIVVSNISADTFKEDIVLLGHIHKPQIIKEKPLILHPGSPYYVRFDEIQDTKGVYIIDTSDLSYQFVKLNPIEAIELTDKDFLKAEDLTGKKIKVIITDLNLLKDVSAKADKFNLKIKLKYTRQNFTISQQSKLSTKSIKDLFIQFCSQNNIPDDIKREILNQL